MAKVLFANNGLGPSSPYNKIRDRENLQDYEINDGPEIVEVSGYRSTYEQVMMAMAAGERLAEFREQQYHYKAGEPTDDGFIDPTVHPSFDFAQAKEMADRFQARLTAKIQRKSEIQAEIDRAAAAGEDPQPIHGKDIDPAKTVDEQV